MKYGGLLFVSGLLLLTCGCGHNVYLERETTGLGALIPVGDSALGFAIGSMKTISATVRGGSSIQTTASARGGIFTMDGAESKITTFKVNQQLNEGNIVKIMQDPEVPKEVKVAIVQNMCDATKAPKFMPSVLQTDSSTIHMGAEAVQSNAVEQIQHHSTGVDKVVETIGDVTHSTVEKVSGTVDKTIDRTIDWSIASKWTVIILAICGVITLLIKKSGSFNEPDDTPSLEEVDPGYAKDQQSPDGEPEQPPEPKQPSAPPSPKKQEKIKFPSLKGKTFWQKIIAIVGALWTMISRIPPETRAKIVNAIKDIFTKWRDKRAKKEAEKK